MVALKRTCMFQMIMQALLLELDPFVKQLNIFLYHHLDLDIAMLILIHC